MEAITTMLNYFWEKIFLTIPICFFTFNQSQIDVIYGVLFMVILDTILGILVGLKYKRLNSNRLAGLVSKVGNYGLAMASVWIVVAVYPEHFTGLFRAMGVFIIITEVFSNFEKLSLLGMTVPTRLLAKLNHDFKRLYFSDDKEKTAKNIIEKRDCKK